MLLQWCALQVESVRGGGCVGNTLCTCPTLCHAPQCEVFVLTLCSFHPPATRPQASSNAAGNVAAVRALAEHPSFNKANPNSCYSLYLAFARSPANFHAGGWVGGPACLGLEGGRLRVVGWCAFLLLQPLAGLPCQRPHRWVQAIALGGCLWVAALASTDPIHPRAWTTIHPTASAPQHKFTLQPMAAGTSSWVASMPGPPSPLRLCPLT